MLCLLRSSTSEGERFEVYTERTPTNTNLLFPEIYGCTLLCSGMFYAWRLLHTISFSEKLGTMSMVILQILLHQVHWGLPLITLLLVDIFSNNTDKTTNLVI